MGFYFWFWWTGYIVMGSAYIFWNRKTQNKCLRSVVLIPRTTTFHFKYVPLRLYIISVWFSGNAKKKCRAVSWQDVRTLRCLQCESMDTVEKKLKEMKIDYVQCRVEEGGIYVDQLFFHDPDGSMIEICNCDNLPVVPLGGGGGGGDATLCSLINCHAQKQEEYFPCVW